MFGGLIKLQFYERDSSLYHLKRLGLIELKGRGRGTIWVLLNPDE